MEAGPAAAWGHGCEIEKGVGIQAGAYLSTATREEVVVELFSEMEYPQTLDL